MPLSPVYSGHKVSVRMCSLARNIVHIFCQLLLSLHLFFPFTHTHTKHSSSLIHGLALACLLPFPFCSSLALLSHQCVEGEKEKRKGRSFFSVGFKKGVLPVLTLPLLDTYKPKISMIYLIICKIFVSKSRFHCRYATTGFQP